MSSNGSLAYVRRYLGDALDVACVRSHLRCQEARVSSLELNYNRTPVNARSAFVPPDDASNDQLENSLATLLPAAVALIDSGFSKFAACAVDEFARREAVDAATNAARIPARVKTIK